jgi:hypothetical protein
MQEIPYFYSLSKNIALSMEIFSLEIYAATGSKQNQTILQQIILHAIRSVEV